MKLFTAIPFLCFFVAASAQENVRESENEIRILSAYHGLDPLPPRATRLCGLPPASGQDGMPVTFSVQIGSASISAAAFAVETSSGEIVTPLCALAAMKKQSKGIAVNSFILYLGAFFISTHSLSQQIVQQCQYSKNQ